MFGYKNILDVAKALFINIITLIIPFIPRWASAWIAGFAGFLAFALLKGRRRAIIGVLKVVKPGASSSELSKFACKNLINYANNFADFLRLYHMDAKELIHITEIEGIEYLKKILQKNKGAILLSGHIGNWEVGSNFIAGYGFPVVGVAESAGPGDAFYKLFKRYREHFGTLIISLEDPSVGFKLRGFLKKGYMIGLIGDRNISGTGVEVNFFGRKAIFPQGPAFLSLVTNCPIIPFFFLRNTKKGKKVYYAFVEKAVEFKGGKSSRENIRNLTQIIAQRIESVVGNYPEQWFSFPPPWGSSTSSE